MAEAGNNGINFMAMLNPQFAAQQQKFELQQAIAQKMMEQGAEQPPTNQLANPGGMVIQNSPVAALARALQQGVGAYSANKNIDNQMQAYQDLANSMNAPSGQTQGNGPALGNAMMGGGSSQAMMNDPTWIRNTLAAGPENATKVWLAQNGKTDLQKNIGDPSTAPYLAKDLVIQTPEGPANVNSVIKGGGQPPAPMGANPSPMSPQGNGGPVALSTDSPPAPQMVNGKPQAPANMDELLNQQTPSTAPKVPMAGDGTPLLPNLKSIPAADPHGIPNYGTPNSTSGVSMNKGFAENDQKANAAFANQAQSLGQEKSRISNLIDTYKQVQAGTLTAQDPEFFQKLAAAGFNDNPEQLKNLAGFQTATQNHILQILGQLKDTNANLEGGQAQRQFASSLNALLEKGESVKDQPQALWNILTQAQGQVDHHLDMMNAYQQVGGMGNRLNGGATMPADTFATQFTLAHPIENYTQKAQQIIPAFKGMAGNSNGGANRPPLSSFMK